MKRDRSLISGEGMKLIETILDYLDRKTQEACFGWMVKMLDVGTQEEIALTLVCDERGYSLGEDDLPPSN